MTIEPKDMTVPDLIVLKTGKLYHDERIGVYRDTGGGIRIFINWLPVQINRSTSGYCIEVDEHLPPGFVTEYTAPRQPPGRPKKNSSVKRRRKRAVA